MRGRSVVYFGSGEGHTGSLGSQKQVWTPEAAPKEIHIILTQKLKDEYEIFRFSVTILLWSFAAAMIVLAGAHWTARQDKRDPLS